MVNEGELGGLCILRGCMPTKAMLASAHALHEATRLDPFGLSLEGEVRADFPRIMARKEAQVARFQRAKIAAVESQDYEVIFGRARFAPGGGVQVGERTLRARRYVIATGSVPDILPLPGLEEVSYLTSDEVMRLDSPPDSLVVQGAGPIGLEMAQFFARIGTEVLLVNRSPLLYRLDAECGCELAAALGAEPRLTLAAPGRIERVKREGSGLLFLLDPDCGPREHRAEALLMATGRRAALEDLGLENVGLEARGGRLEHDEHMRTAHPEVYVAGDATGRFQILHLANQEGVVAGHNAAGGEPERVMDYRLKMSVVFTDPPFAQVGLSGAEAAAAGDEVLVGRARLPETGRAITMGVEHGLWKVFADRESGELLGSVILGPRADDLIHLISLSMLYRGRAADLLAAPWYHPTLSEVLLDILRDLEAQAGR
jgi:pyruvate/2-oxoglutarate dehydrogenase complex dihydrolipoamide dehydrogenase (E3) component